MQNCDRDIRGYYSNRVALTKSQREELGKRRNTNRDRLKAGLEENDDPLPDKTISQGSYAMRTIIQEPNNTYDIDDGVVFMRKSLMGPRGGDKSALDARNMVRNAVDDERFSRSPEVKTNCVRVFYDDGPHVDIPVYRSVLNCNGINSYELASSNWKESDPEGVNSWFLKCLEYKKNQELKYFRELICLLKSFCKQRTSYSLPSGFVLTVLVDECYFTINDRIDLSLHNIIVSIYKRLCANINVSHPVVNEFLIDDNNAHKAEKLRDILGDAVQNLEYLNQPNCTYYEALKRWKKVLKTDYFDDKIIVAEKDEKIRTKSRIIVSTHVVKPYGYTKSNWEI